MQDYVGAILGLVRDESDWRLNPLMVSYYLALFDIIAQNKRLDYA
jgi:hypothetical protein